MDQAGYVMGRAIHESGDRIALQFCSRVGNQQREEVVGLGLIGVEPALLIPTRQEDDRHAIVDGLQQGIGHRGQDGIRDGIREHLLAVCWVSPCVVQAGKGNELVIPAMDVVWTKYGTFPSLVCFHSKKPDGTRIRWVLKALRYAGFSATV